MLYSTLHGLLHYGSSKVYNSVALCTIRTTDNQPSNISNRTQKLIFSLKMKQRPGHTYIL